MAQTNFTPLSLYYSTTPGAVPTAGSLVSGELALNIADGLLYYKNSGGAVTPYTAGASGGTVTSVGLSGGSTGLTVSNSPITTSGIMFLGGVLGVANGGTGTTASTGTGSTVLSTSPALTGTPTAPTQPVGNNSAAVATTAFVQAAVANTPASVVGLGFGGTQWNNVTGARATGQTYTNSRSYPIAISVYGSGTGSSNTQIYINGGLVYYNNAQWNGAGAIPGGWLIVPPGATYLVILSTGVSGWWELY